MKKKSCDLSELTACIAKPDLKGRGRERERTLITCYLTPSIYSISKKHLTVKTFVILELVWVCSFYRKG